MNETYVTIQGRLVADPTVRHTRAGMPFAVFRLAHSARRPVPGEPGRYTDGQTSFYSVSAFRSLGANVGTALRKGEPVTVYGRQRISTWERSDGSTGTSVEVEAYAVGHDLTYGTTAFSKVARAQFSDGDRMSQPEVREAFAESELGDPERDPYVVDGGPGRGLGEAGASDDGLGIPGTGDESTQTNSGPLVPPAEEDAA